MLEGGVCLVRVQSSGCGSVAVVLAGVVTFMLSEAVLETAEGDSA